MLPWHEQRSSRVIFLVPGTTQTSRALVPFVSSKFVGFAAHAAALILMKACSQAEIYVFMDSSDRWSGRECDSRQTTGFCSGGEGAPGHNEIILEENV